MRAKHILWFIAAVIGIISMAAGVAVLINRLFPEKVDNYGYIECDCDPDEE